jgi:hypothetical protein
MALAVLAHIQGGEMEAKDLNLADQRGQPALRNALLSVFHQACAHQFEVVQQLGGRMIGIALGFALFSRR